jgi:hypothetical protein
VALVAVALLLIVVASGGRTSSAPKGDPTVAARAHVARPITPLHRSAPSPGSLSQTNAYPSARSAQFKAQMALLWAGVVGGSAGPAIGAFFPKGAYLQLKAIAAAGSDWTNRLVQDYSLDITAAHGLLGRGAPGARLLGVEVQSSYGHWIAPGVCENSVGYYEMPNARVLYSEGGQTRSFGIASMISWRGVWYVVHLGAVLRPAEEGIVDEPASGAGESAYSGTC